MGRGQRCVPATATVLVAAFVSGLVAAPVSRPSVAVPPPVEPPPTSRPAWPPMTKEQLDPIYRAELGAFYAPQMLDAIYGVHQLVELYFESPSMKERKAVAGQIESTKVPAAVIGRLCRLRMYWPELPAGGVYYVNEKTGVYPTRYFFGLPTHYDRAKKWPLVIRLPTAQPFVSDPPPTADQVTQLYKQWIEAEQRVHPDAVVVMPLLNLDELWGPSYAGMNSVLLPMQHVAGRVNVDPARVYLVGHSMSAHAAWNLALHYPTYFAAFNPLAGGASASWQRLRVANLRNTLPVVWHDADDDVIKVDVARTLIKAVRLQKVDVQYIETKGLGHAPDADTAEKAYAAMRARERKLYPSAVTIQSNRPDTVFNRSDWLQIYQPVETGKEHHAILRYGSGTFVYTDASWRVDAVYEGQKFELKTINVDSLRLYVNDQMMDLSKPITVTVNGRPRLEGIIKPSITELLADQLVLGRGWRYFTAAIDVAMTPRVERPTTRPTTRPATSSSTRPPSPASTRPAAPARPPTPNR